MTKFPLKNAISIHCMVGQPEAKESLYPTVNRPYLMKCNRLLQYFMTVGNNTFLIKAHYGRQITKKEQCNKIWDFEWMH